MIGNVHEWTNDCFTASYWGRPPDERAWIWSGGCEQRVIRGGSWMSRPTDARPARRQGRLANAAADDLGFRVARHLSDDELPAVDDQRNRIVLFTEDVEQTKQFWIERFGYTVTFEDREFKDEAPGVGSGTTADKPVHFVILAPPSGDEPIVGLIGSDGGTRVVVQEAETTP